MEKSCKNCKHGVDLKVAGDVKFFACSEAFYKKIKFDPPSSITKYGNLQILPKPIAEPAAARIKPNFDENKLLLIICLFKIINLILL